MTMDAKSLPLADAADAPQSLEDGQSKQTWDFIISKQEVDPAHQQSEPAPTANEAHASIPDNSEDNATMISVSSNESVTNLPKTLNDDVSLISLSSSENEELAFVATTAAKDLEPSDAPAANVSLSSEEVQYVAPANISSESEQISLMTAPVLDDSTDFGARYVAPADPSTTWTDRNADYLAPADLSVSSDDRSCLTPANLSNDQHPGSNASLLSATSNDRKDSTMASVDSNDESLYLDNSAAPLRSPELSTEDGRMDSQDDILPTKSLTDEEKFDYASIANDTSALNETGFTADNTLDQNLLSLAESGVLDHELFGIPDEDEISMKGSLISVLSSENGPGSAVLAAISEKSVLDEDSTKLVPTKTGDTSDDASEASTPIKTCKLQKGDSKRSSWISRNKRNVLFVGIFGGLIITFIIAIGFGVGLFKSESSPDY